jgi:hypothetical protein
LQTTDARDAGDPGNGPRAPGASHAANPTFLFDIFARAGGARPGRASGFITINSNNVVGDNFWLWRADHGSGAGWNANTNRNGLIVNRNDVTVRLGGKDGSGRCHLLNDNLSGR